MTTKKQKPTIVICHCTRPKCKYVATARRESAAVQAIASHLVKIHGLGQKAEAA